MRHREKEEKTVKKKPLNKSAHKKRQPKASTG